MTPDSIEKSREAFEIAVIERMKESGFLEIEIRVEALVRCGDGYQDELINAGWHYWKAGIAAVSPPVVALPDDATAEEILQSTIHHPNAVVMLKRMPDARASAVELLAAERAEKEAFAEEIKEAAYEAWPEASDVGSDAPHIIRQLGQERKECLAEVEDLKNNLSRVEADNAAKDTEIAGLTSVIGELVATIPVSKTLSASATAKALIEYFKELHADNAAKDAQLERFRSDPAYTVGFTDGHAAAEAKLAAAVPPSGESA